MKHPALPESSLPGPPVPVRPAFGVETAAILLTGLVMGMARILDDDVLWVFGIFGMWPLLFSYVRRADRLAGYPGGDGGPGVRAFTVTVFFVILALMQGYALFRGEVGTGWLVGAGLGILGLPFLPALSRLRSVPVVELAPPAPAHTYTPPPVAGDGREPMPRLEEEHGRPSPPFIRPVDADHEPLDDWAL